MTNVRRPIHLQLRPDSLAFSSAAQGRPAATTPMGTAARQQQLNKAAALHSTNQDALPNQILPHLYVGNQEQTNRDTLNRLNIGYILSLGLLPIVSNSNSPTSPTTTTSNGRAGTPTNNQTILLPNENTSIDFKVRVRTSASSAAAASLSHTDSSVISTPANAVTSTTPSPIKCSSVAKSTSTNELQQHQQQQQRDENKGVRSVRSIYCKCINISDNSNQDLIKFFDEAYQFIEEARRKKCNVLVHCLAGISRSPTVAIAYLMRVNSLRLQDAYKLVKKCRPQIDPNLSFMGQLMLYDKTLRQIREANNNSNSVNSTTDSKESSAQHHTCSNKHQQRQHQQQTPTNHNCFCDRLRDH